MSTNYLRPLSFGEILDGSFTLYRRQFASMFLTGLLAQLPIVAMYLWMAGVAASGRELSLGMAMVFTYPAMLVVSVSANAALTWQMSRAYTGAPVGSGPALRVGIGRLLPLLGAYVVVGFAAMVGVIAFLVGALVVMFLSLFVTAAVVLERQGPVDAFSRSVALAKGAMGRVFGVAVVTWVISMLPYFTITMLATFAMGSLAHEPGQMVMAQYAARAVGQLAASLTLPFSVGATVLLYFDRRVRTEALDVRMAAEALPQQQGVAPAIA